MERLSDELVLNILLSCAVPDVLSLAETCKRLRRITSDPQLWRRMLLRYRGETLVGPARMLRGDRHSEAQLALLQRNLLDEEQALRLSAGDAPHDWRVRFAREYRSKHLLETKHQAVKMEELKGHKHSVLAMDVDPAKSLLATASADHTCKVWDLRHFQPLAVFKEHQTKVLSVHLVTEPSGETVCLSGGDAMIYEWRFESNRPSLAFRGHTNSVSDISTKGKHMISVSYDGSIKLWNRATAQVIQTVIEAHVGPISCLSIFEDRLVTGSFDHSIKIWKLSDRFGAVDEEHADQPSTDIVSISPDVVIRTESTVKCLTTSFNEIFAGFGTGSVAVFNVFDGSRTRNIAITAFGSIQSISADEHKIVIGNFEGTRWDNFQLQSFLGSTGRTAESNTNGHAFNYVTGIRTVPGRPRIICSFLDNTVRVFDF